LPGANGDAVVIANTNASIVIDSAFESLSGVGVEASDTVTVKLAVPVAVGVPVIVPFDARDKPAGRLPGPSVHVKAVVAGDAVNVCE
jgi:hypothetical protein